MTSFQRTRKFLYAALGVLLCACAPAAAQTPLPPAASPIPIEQPTSILPTQAPPAAATAGPTVPVGPTAVLFEGPLSVIISQPADSETVDRSPLRIQGTADAGTVLTINDAMILVDASRVFSIEIPLEPGSNVIELVASDASSAQEFSYLTVFYEPAQ